MYEWLIDYQKLIQEIDYLEFNLERSEIELKRWVSGDLRGVRLTEESIASTLEERIEQMKKDIVFKKNQLNMMIDLVDKFKGLDHRILKLKYVDGMTLDEVAEELNYSSSHIKKKHAELVRLIKFVDEQGII